MANEVFVPELEEHQPEPPKTAEWFFEGRVVYAKDGHWYGYTVSEPTAAHPAVRKYFRV